MRVTSQNLANQATSSVRRNNREQLQFQSQISTGKRIQRPSDDPLAITSVLVNRNEERRLGTHLENIRDASFLLESGVDAITEVRNVLNDATGVALEAASDNLGEVQAATLAAKTERLLDRLLALGNTRLADGRSLFSGVASDLQAFTVLEQSADGQPTKIAYQGADQAAEAIVGRNSTVDTLLSGNRIFQAHQRGETIFQGGNTGALAGSGTDSSTGQGTLIVRHTSTTFVGTSGVAAGASSPDGDSILGVGHVLTFNAGTVVLNGGNAVTFTNADTDLEVTGGSGETIFLDLSGVSLAFVGTDAVSADGELSTDNGATFLAIDFADDNQAVVDSVTGQVTFVDSTGIQRTGSETIDNVGAYDVFETVIALREDLASAQSLDGAARGHRLSRRLEELERLRDSALSVLGEHASAAENVESLRTRTEDLQFEVQRFRTELEAVDMAEAIVNLQNQQNLFQASLLVAARVSQFSLANFLS